jgi:hypothetical protein
MRGGGKSDQLKIGCRLQATVANSVYLELYHSAPGEVAKRTNLGYCQAGLFPKIVEIESLWLSVFVVYHNQIGDGLSCVRAAIGLAGLLALRSALRFLSLLLQTGTFLLAFGKSCTRASCHNPLRSLTPDLINLLPRKIHCSDYHAGLPPI